MLPVPEPGFRGRFWAGLGRKSDVNTPKSFPTHQLYIVLKRGKRHEYNMYSINLNVDHLYKIIYHFIKINKEEGSSSGYATVLKGANQHEKHEFKET